jgi:hypothetical protein
MKKSLDCLFIGHNDMDLVNVLQALKKKSPLAQIHNIHYRTGDTPRTGLKVF